MNDLSTSFRDVMADVCTPVSVITGMNGERPHSRAFGTHAPLRA